MNDKELADQCVCLLRSARQVLSYYGMFIRMVIVRVNGKHKTLWTEHIDVLPRVYKMYEK